MKRSTMSKSVIVLCAGGHAKVLVDALKLSSRTVLGLTDADTTKMGQLILGVHVIGSDNIIFTHKKEEIELVNGLGSVGKGYNRKILYENFKNQGYHFSTVIHPSAIIASDVILSEGAQVMAGVVIQASSHIGKNVLINTRASVDHDCIIGDHCHIAPGVVLSGGVKIGEGVHVGAGATIIQGIKIGNNALIAAGAVVINDVAEGAFVAGVPAKVNLT